MDELIPPDSPRRSWLARVLDLGNNNKIIAAATLVTLATGVPYLIMSMLSAFDEQPEYSPEMLVAAIAHLQIQADESAARGEGGAVGQVESASGALSAIAREAERSGATAKERRDIVKALQDYGTGDHDAILAKLAEIARRQEARGDVEAAAATWCQRAALQSFTDTGAALRDYERANDLSEAGIDAFSQLERSRMLRYALRMDESVTAMRKAIRKAQQTGDREVEAETHFALSTVSGTSWEGEPEFEAEQQRSGLRAMELYEELIAEDPTRFKLYAELAASGAQAGGGDALLYGYVATENEDSAAIATRLEAALEKVRALQPPMISKTGRHIAVGNLAAACAYVRSGMQDQDDLTPRYLEAVDNGLAALEDPEIATENLRMLLLCFVLPLKAFDEGRNLAGMERVNAGMLKLTRSLSARDPENPMLMANLGGAIMTAGCTALANDNPERGLALLEESLDGYRAMNTMLDPQMGASYLAYGYMEAAKSLPHQYDDQALAWAHEAKRIYDENLQAWSQESRWSNSIQELDAFFAEYGIAGAVE